MNDYLLDTNHFSPMTIIGHSIEKRVHQQIRFGDTFSVPMVVATETLYGLLGLPRAKQNLQTWDDLRVMFNFYDAELTDAEDAAYLQHRLRKEGKQLETVDALIAAIAIRYNMILLTTDQDFDHVPNLSVENWHE